MARWTQRRGQRYENDHLKNKGKMMIERQFDSAFALKYMQKDFDLIFDYRSRPRAKDTIIHPRHCAPGLHVSERGWVQRPGLRWHGQVFGKPGWVRDFIGYPLIEHKGQK